MAVGAGFDYDEHDERHWCDGTRDGYTATTRLADRADFEMRPNQLCRSVLTQGHRRRLSNLIN